MGATQGGSHAEEDHACRGGGIVLGGRADVRAGPGNALRRAVRRAGRRRGDQPDREDGLLALWLARDRKSTRLNSSHQIISYAVFCLKKKIKQLHEVKITY